MTPTFILSAIICLAVLAAILYFLFKPAKQVRLSAFPTKWKKFLEKDVRFYRELDLPERGKFEERIQRFLQVVKVTGVETDVTWRDELLVAASGIIPTFGFPAWNHYPRLREVLLYNTSFRRGDFATTGEGRNIGGMVGGGYLSGKLLLSKPSLRSGFETRGPDNTGIHEFVHLIDMSDGNTDGVPEYFLDHAYVIPWVDLMHQEMTAIESGRSDIDDYALTNQAEFFAVVSEYFFNQPGKFAEHHPKIFALMETIFDQDWDDEVGMAPGERVEILRKLAEGGEG